MLRSAGEVKMVSTRTQTLALNKEIVFSAQCKKNKKKKQEQTWQAKNSQYFVVGVC